MEQLSHFALDHGATTCAASERSSAVLEAAASASRQAVCVRRTVPSQLTTTLLPLLLFATAAHVLLDVAAQVRHLSSAVRDEVGSRLLQLTLKELFEWRFMQTDPNWCRISGFCICQAGCRGICSM